MNKRCEDSMKQLIIIALVFDESKPYLARRVYRVTIILSAITEGSVLLHNEPAEPPRSVGIRSRWHRARIACPFSGSSSSGTPPIVSMRSRNRSNTTRRTQNAQTEADQGRLLAATRSLASRKEPVRDHHGTPHGECSRPGT